MGEEDGPAEVGPVEGEAEGAVDEAGAVGEADGAAEEMGVVGEAELAPPPQAPTAIAITVIAAIVRGAPFRRVVKATGNTSIQPSSPHPNDAH